MKSPGAPSLVCYYWYCVICVKSMLTFADDKTEKPWTIQEGSRPHKAHPLYKLCPMCAQGQGHQEVCHQEYSWGGSCEGYCRCFGLWSWVINYSSAVDVGMIYIWGHNLVGWRKEYPSQNISISSLYLNRRVGFLINTTWKLLFPVLLYSRSTWVWKHVEQYLSFSVPMHSLFDNLWYNPL